MEEKRGTYFYQQMLKERNREKILSLLKDGPQRFTDLQETSKFSPRGLTGILKDLEEGKKIKKILHNKKQAYELTERGFKLFSGSYLLRSMIEGMEKNNSKYYESYSAVQPSSWFCRLPWGIDDDLLVENSIDEKYNPITKEIAGSINEDLYKKIKEIIIKKKIPTDATMEGKILLCISIDYKELIQSIEQDSLEYQKRISKHELDLLNKMEHGDITSGIINELLKIRKNKSKGKTKLGGVDDN